MEAGSGSLLGLGLRCERLAALDDEVNGKDDKQDGQDRTDVAPGNTSAAGDDRSDLRLDGEDQRRQRHEEHESGR